jgi:hypothetical protein
MSLGEQLNELDRKVLGAAPVDRAEPAAPYEPSVGELAPLGRSLSLRASLFALGALVTGLHLVFGGSWKTLLICLAIVVIPALLVAKLSTNSFPAVFPDAPSDALATAKVSRSGRLVVAALVAAVCVLDVLFLHGKGQEVLFVLAGLPAVVLWSIAGEVSEREEDGFVLASRVKQQGRVGRGIYRVPTN